MRQVMPARLRQRIDTLEITALGPGGAPAPHVDPAVLVALAGAVQAHAVLRFDYATATTADAAPDADATRAAVTTSAATPDSGLVARRTVEPHHVVSRHGRWYLLA